MSRPVLAFTLIPLLLPSLPPATNGEARWAAMGHRIVVELAWDGLTPRARAAATGLLGGEVPGRASVWADEIRGARRETAPLHFVNIPLGAGAYDSATVCPRGRCIVSAIGSARATLADPAAPRVERQEALKFLLHLVGDLHSPVHVSDRNDRGGNQLGVTWRGRDTNLHAVWDDQLPRAWAVSEGRYLARLRATIRRMSPEERARAAAGSVEGWAMDGNALAERVVYRMPGGALSQPSYIRAAGPAMDLQLIRAGLRLARLVNQALDPGTSPVDD